jgi:hypothetical protein
MKTRNNNKPIQGFSQQDRNYLRQFDNAQADPELQILTEEDFEEEEPEQRQYFCAICKSRLDYLEGSKTIWRCNECTEYYDTNNQDVPLKDISELRVKTYPELSYYQTWDEEDPNMVFMEQIDLGEQNIPRNVEILRDDHRVKHIRIRGSPVEALAAMNELDGKE